MDNDKPYIQIDTHSFSDSRISDSKPFNPLGIVESNSPNNYPFIFGFGLTSTPVTKSSNITGKIYTSQDFMSTFLGQNYYSFSNYPQATTTNDIVFMKDEFTNIINTYYAAFLEDEESDISDELQVWFEKYKIRAVGYTLELYKAGQLSDKLMSIILKIIGRLNDADSYSERLLMLEYYLLNPAPLIRFGSIIGLSNFKDETIINSIDTALHNENIPMNIGLLKSLKNKLT